MPRRRLHSAAMPGPSAGQKATSPQRRGRPIVSQSLQRLPLDTIHARISIGCARLPSTTRIVVCRFSGMAEATHPKGHHRALEWDICMGLQASKATEHVGHYKRMVSPNYSPWTPLAKHSLVTLAYVNYRHPANTRSSSAKSLSLSNRPSTVGCCPRFLSFGSHSSCYSPATVD